MKMLYNLFIHLFKLSTVYKDKFISINKELGLESALKLEKFQNKNILYNVFCSLKVPKREIFVTKLIILCHPIWIGDLRTKAKNLFV